MVQCVRTASQYRIQFLLSERRDGTTAKLQSTPARALSGDGREAFLPACLLPVWAGPTAPAG